MVTNTKQLGRHAPNNNYVPDYLLDACRVLATRSNVPDRAVVENKDDAVVSPGRLPARLAEHLVRVSSRLVVGDKNLIPKNTCCVCATEFVDRDELFRHLRTHGHGVITCSGTHLGRMLCNKIVQGSSAMELLPFLGDIGKVNCQSQLDTGETPLLLVVMRKYVEDACQRRTRLPAKHSKIVTRNGFRFEKLPVGNRRPVPRRDLGWDVLMRVMLFLGANPVKTVPVQKHVRHTPMGKLIQRDNRMAPGIHRTWPESAPFWGLGVWDLSLSTSSPVSLARSMEDRKLLGDLLSMNNQERVICFERPAPELHCNAHGRNVVWCCKLARKSRHDALKEQVETYKLKGCGHTFCNASLTEHLEYQIFKQRRSFKHLTCVTCKFNVAQQDVVRLVSRAALESCEQNSLQQALYEMDDFYFCPNQDCKSGGFSECPATLTSDPPPLPTEPCFVSCSDCDTRFCRDCGVAENQHKRLLFYHGRHGPIYGDYLTCAELEGEEYQVMQSTVAYRTSPGSGVTVRIR